MAYSTSWVQASRKMLLSGEMYLREYFISDQLTLTETLRAFLKRGITRKVRSGKKRDLVTLSQGREYHRKERRGYCKLKRDSSATKKNRWIWEWPWISKAAILVLYRYEYEHWNKTNVKAKVCNHERCISRSSKGEMLLRSWECGNYRRHWERFVTILVVWHPHWTWNFLVIFCSQTWDFIVGSAAFKLILYHSI